MTLNEPVPSAVPPRVRCVARGKKSLYVFVPKCDITVWELAESMELLLAGVDPAMRDGMWEGMGEGVKRHWDVRDMSQVQGVRVPSGLMLPSFGRGR